MQPVLLRTAGQQPHRPMNCCYRYPSYRENKERKEKKAEKHNEVIDGFCFVFVCCLAGHVGSKEKRKRKTYVRSMKHGL